jgi:hypothetical protein
MKRNLLVTCLLSSSLLLAGGLVACGGDDEPTGPGTPTGDQGLALSVLNDVVTPMITQFNMAPYISFLAPTPEQCEPIQFCSSGTAEKCVGQSGLTLNFDQCSALGSVFTGSIVLVGDATSGSATFDLTADSDSLSGTVTYGFYPDCDGLGATGFSQSFDGMSITTTDLSMIVGGFLDYCNPATVNNVEVPTFATFLVELPQLERYVNVSLFSSENPGDYEITVLNLSQTVILLACHGNLFSGSPSCFVP